MTTLSSKRAALAAQLAALDAEEAKAAEAMECARLRPTIDEGEASDIATVLLDRRERGLRIVQLDALPSSLRSIEDVYAVHAAMCSISSTLGDHIGFKVGAAGAAAMKSMGLVEPFRAPLFATSIVKSASEDRDTCFPPSSIIACEAEVAFVLDRDLPARPGSGGGGGEGGGHLPYCGEPRVSSDRGVWFTLRGGGGCRRESSSQGRRRWSERSLCAWRCGGQKHSRPVGGLFQNYCGGDE